LIQRARALLSVYEDMAELVRLGAYRRGTDPQVDEAIQYQPALDAFLNQNKRDHTDLAGGYAGLAKVLGVPWPQ
jgi:flagellum-specific ATP synthase